MQIIRCNKMVLYIINYKLYIIFINKITFEFDDNIYFSLI